MRPDCRAVYVLEGRSACPLLQRLAPLRRVAGEGTPAGRRYYVCLGASTPASTLGYADVDPTTTTLRRADLHPANDDDRCSPTLRHTRHPSPLGATVLADLEGCDPAALDDDALTRWVRTLDAAWRRAHQEQLRRVTAGEAALSAYAESA